MGAGDFGAIDDEAAELAVLDAEIVQAGLEADFAAGGEDPRAGARHDLQQAVAT